ncbi:MAG: alkane 1-monooxygenase [Pseudomonadota bacterium]|nr:alkane 1-monooxygenase [Pseudomonadota bacterium]
MPLLVYALVYLVPAFTFVGLYAGGVWTWVIPAVIFGLVPVLELLFPGARVNVGGVTEAARRADPRFDALLVGVVPVQVALVLTLAGRANALVGWELAGAFASVGICCGALGINVAHELGHRADRGHQRLAKVLLLTSLYQHFFIEHNRGHHAHVATPNDPASARRGEALYPFWARSVVGGWLSAWRIEAERLARGGHGAWSFANEMVVFGLVQVAFVAALALIAGPRGALAVVAAATVGVLLLETVNYVEHYGLSRERLPDGRWERVRPAHSWTSDHLVSRVLLFELTRHADHHAHPGRPYAVLRHFDDAPSLPTGYAGMVLLALCPPLFRLLMDRQLARESTRLSQRTSPMAAPSPSPA